MQLTIIYALVALLPALAMTSPVSNDEITDVADNVLMKRGIDICPPEYRVAGGNCKFGSSKNDPHACGKNNPAVILVCRGGKWALERKCGGGKRCKCTGSNSIKRAA